MPDAVSEMFGVVKLMLTFSFVLALALLIVMSLPNSPLKNALTPFARLGFALLCCLYVISPVDIVPEVALGPFGLIDDIGAVWMGVNAARTAFSKPKEKIHA